MFKANQPNQYVPSKSVAIKPEVVSNVSQNEQIRIQVPSFVGFIDPNQTFLKFNLTHSNVRGQLVPDPDAGGGHSLFRNVMYRDGNNQTTIEFNEDYNANMCLLKSFTETPSVIHKRELFNGVQNTIGDNHKEQTLYYAQRQDPTAGTNGNTPDETTRPANSPTLLLPLNSGIWKQGNILPVSAMNGLRIVIDTEDILRSHRYVDLRGEFVNRKVTGHHVLSATANKAVGDDKRNAGVNPQFIATQCPMAANPFDIGDRLYIADAGTGANEETLGDVVGFSETGGNVRVSYVPDRNNDVGLTSAHNIGSLIYYKVEDRQTARAVYKPTDNAGNVKTGSVLAPTYTLSDIELIVQSVQPPAQYVEGMLKASGSEKGVSMDFMTYELHRFNQANKLGLTQIQIPTLMKRAKSLFSQPLPTSSAVARGFGHSSLTGLVDQAKNYEWVWGTQHYPSRLVPLERYSQAVAGGENRNEALHTSELQKAIVNVNEPVRNLQQIAKHFSIPRALTKYGQVMDLSTQTLSLRVDYNAGATEDKLFNNYIYGLKRLTINKFGVSIM
tara:strand:+ start:5122 stop:6789 length:1668 start_codon:yes stop_codon:yes gene_type:complete